MRSFPSTLTLDSSRYYMHNNYNHDALNSFTFLLQSH